MAAHDQGAQVTYLGPTGSQMGKKESVKDTARVLGRMYDGIEYRGYGNGLYGCWAEFSGVPSGTASPRNFIRRGSWPIC